MIYFILRVIFCTFFKIIFRAEIIGKENLPMEGAAIVAANHMSNWDPPLLACFLPRPVGYMAKEELFRNPVFGGIIRRAHAFPVKRGAADRGAIKAAVQVLKTGHCLGLFPEGTRSRTGQMKKAEAGVGLIAAMTDAPVVPAAIVGTDKIFANGGHFPKLRVIYGKPLHFTGDRKDKEQLAVFSQNIMDEIARMKNVYEKKQDS